MSRIPSCADASADKCPACQHSSLSLLLLRPSPIPKQGALAHPSAQRVQSDDALVSGFVPAITESRYVLRLLREGYVHMYIPAPPAGMKQWYSYRVSQQADVLAMANPACSMADISCCREGHNKMGYKLLNIPRAHEIGEVWIAFSANQWSDTLKAKNAGNPKVMQQVKLSGCGPYTFKPSADALRQKVMDFAISPREDKVQGDFPLVSLSAQSADHMAAELQRVAALHPKTKGHELAVVLRDPVGVAAELNAIRLRWHELVQQELKKPEIAHPLNSSNVLQGLRQSILDSNHLDSYDQVSPLRFRKAFLASKEYPSGTGWEPLSDQVRRSMVQQASTSILLAPYKAVYQYTDLGRVVYPDYEERASTWAKQQTEATWKSLNLDKYYDEAARNEWVSAFEKRMQTEYWQPLERFEQDWLHAVTDQQALAYFACHFDPLHGNKLTGEFTCGIAYAAESYYIHQPAPLTTGEVLDQYIAATLGKPLTDPSAIAMRALLGNQKSVIDVVHEQLTDDLRDKSYDFLKSALGIDAGTAALKKYSWLGDTVAAFSVGQLAAISGAVSSIGARQLHLGDAVAQQVSKLQQLWAVQQAIERAIGSALAGKAPKIPVLIQMQVSAHEAMAVWRARKGQALGTSATSIKRVRRRDGKVWLTLLTDTDAIKSAKGDVHAMAKEAQQGEVKLAKGAAAAAAGASLALTEEQFLKLYATQSTLGTKAVNAVRTSLQSGAGHQFKAIVMGIEGRLALGVMFVQGLGLVSGLKAIKEDKNAEHMRIAWYGLYDSTAGVLGGLMETWAVARSASIIATVGEQAAKTVIAQSLSIGALRFAGNIGGAAGSLAVAASSWARSDKAKEIGDMNAAKAYERAGYLFSGLAINQLVTAIGAGADTLAARGVGGAVVESIALRVGATGVLAEVGGVALTVSGIGLVLLAAGIAFQVGAVALTPSDIQRWVSRSYFGKDPGIIWDGKRDDMFKKGDWAAELEALDAVLGTKKTTDRARENNAIAATAH